MKNVITRRRLLKAAGCTVLSGSHLIDPEKDWAQMVPNSAGTQRPRLRVPANACDCHHHVYDAVRFPPAPPAERFQRNARLEEYRLLQRRIGTSRNIVVTPFPYSGNNDITLDAVARVGPNARGIVVVRPDVTDAELKSFANRGIRGIRFSVGNPARPTVPTSVIVSLAKRVNDFGWHVQLGMRGDQIVSLANVLDGLPTPIVIDHMGVLPGPDRLNHPGFGVIRRLIDKGRTWVKLSAPYIQATIDQSGEVSFSYSTNFAPATKVAQAYVKAAPERMLWGSDWPHPGFGDAEKPDDAVLLDLLTEWAPDEATRHRILIENPETLYGFTNWG